MKLISVLAATALVSFATVSAMAASSAPSALCGEDKEGDDDDSIRLCGEDKEGDDDDSIRLCGEDKEGDDDDSVRLELAL